MSGADVEMQARVSAGFSLVETLATLTVVALAAGGVLLFAPRDDDSARAAAERLAAQLAAASDESVMRNRAVALVLSPEGYAFRKLEAFGWLPTDDTVRLRPRVWPEGVTAFADAESVEGRTVVFDPTGGSSPARIVLAARDRRWTVSVDEAGGVHVEAVR